MFGRNYQTRVAELKDNYTSIFQNTTKALALKWIKQNIPDISGSSQPKSINMTLDFVFNSSDHLRYENGKHVSGPHGGAGRAVKVEPNIHGKEGFTVTLYNLDGDHPVWQNNVQMAPKQMKIYQEDSSKIVSGIWT